MPETGNAPTAGSSWPNNSVSANGVSNGGGSVIQSPQPLAVAAADLAQLGHRMAASRVKLQFRTPQWLNESDDCVACTGRQAISLDDHESPMYP